LAAHDRIQRAPLFNKAPFFREKEMSVHLKIEERRAGLVATISQRDGEGNVIGHPSVELVASAAEAKQLAKTLAQSLGLKVYGMVDKTKSAAHPGKPPGTIAKAARRDADPTAAEKEPPPWLVPGVGKSL
jgi:hypothetical protein